MSYESIRFNNINLKISFSFVITRIKLINHQILLDKLFKISICTVGIKHFMMGSENIKKIP